MPRASSASQIRMVRVLSPTIAGTICVVEGPVSQPAARSPARLGQMPLAQRRPAVLTRFLESQD